MAGLLGHLNHCFILASSWAYADLNAAFFFAPLLPFVFLPTLTPLFCLPYPTPPHLCAQMEVAKVVGAPPVYPLILTANPLPLLLHTCLFLGISTYQVRQRLARNSDIFFLFFFLNLTTFKKKSHSSFDLNAGKNGFMRQFHPFHVYETTKVHGSTMWSNQDHDATNWFPFKILWWISKCFK